MAMAIRIFGRMAVYLAAAVVLGVLAVVRGLENGTKGPKWQGRREDSPGSEDKNGGYEGSGPGSCGYENGGPGSCGHENGRHESCWPEAYGPNGLLSTVALVVGVIFVILAGCMFATTAWRVLSSVGKLLSVFGLSAVFFAGSLVAERKFRIEKTAAACHILGCVFLALTFVTAGYFRMLGPVFAWKEDGWWCVIGMGILSGLSAMGLGLFRFHKKGYRGIAVVSGLAGSAFLILQIADCVAYKFMGDAADGCWIPAFCVFAMGYMLLAGGFLSWKYEKPLAELVFSLALAELVHYGILHINVAVESQVFLAAAAMTLCFYVCRILKGRSGRSCSLAGEGVLTVALFWDTLVLALVGWLSLEVPLVQLWTVLAVCMTGIVMRAWGKKYIFVRAAIPLVTWYLTVPLSFLAAELFGGDGWFEWMLFLFAASFMALNALRSDVWGPGIAAIGTFALLFATLDDGIWWEAVWMALLGLSAADAVRKRRYGHAAAALAVLVIDVLLAGGLLTAVLLECICFALFLLAHKNGDGRWERVYGGLMPAAAAYMMRDYWFDIAWWVYLLIAGVGLILFAAVREKRD